MVRCLISVAIVFLLFGCKKQSAPNNDKAGQAKTDLRNILDVMERHSVYRNNVNWTELKQSVLGMVDDYNSYEANMSKGVGRALTMLGDKHSSFNFPDGASVMGESNLRCEDSIPVMLPMDNSIGYVKMDAFGGTDGYSCSQYIKSVQQQIVQADNANLKGWIIDLRTNRGGNFNSMLQSIVPILGVGTPFYSLYPDNTFEPTSIDPSMMNIYYQVLKPNARIAVLTSRNTADAGEGIAICFKGWANSKSFGNSTYGTSTYIEDFDVYLSGTLHLAVALMGDRNKTPYGGSVPPDELETSPTSAMQKAIAWLKQ